jgi:hypothetical protein
MRCRSLAEMSVRRVLDHRTEEIAAVLTSEGRRSPNCADKVLPITVWRIRLSAGLKELIERRPRWRHSPDLLSAHELARALSIPGNWL